MPAWLIRHAQSTANAGAPSESPTTTAITDLGRQQAQEVADWFPEQPDLVVASPYIRTQQTAEPLVERFKVPQDIWPVQEFTFLNPELYRGTTQAQRLPHANEYWLRNDAHHRDENAESFVDFIQRCYDLIERLEALKDKNVVVFTHGRFIQGVYWLLVEGGDEGHHAMRYFRFFCDQIGVVPNASVITLGEDWRPRLTFRPGVETH